MRAAAALLLAVATAMSAGASDVPTVSKAADEAYQNKDWSGYLTNARKLDLLRPGNPRILYNLAGAYALNGETDLAINTLSRVAAMGIVLPAAKDSDFASISEDERFAATLEALEQNKKEIGKARTVLTIEEMKGQIPEGIAYDAKSGTTYVGFVRDRALWAIRKGEASRVSIPAPNIWSIMGMAFDNENRRLLFCTSATPMMKNHDNAAIGSSSVVAWDPEKKEVIGRWDAPGTTENPHWFGDLTLGGDGEIYVSDSRANKLYIIRKGSDTIEPWLENEDIASAQGLTWNPKRKRLYLADYSLGIWSIDPKTGISVLLEAPKNATVLGIDGLYSDGKDLIGIQNGTAPHRIIRMKMNPTGTRIEEVEILEANRPEFDEPTLGFVHKGDLWFVATSQWGSFNDDGTMIEGAEAKPAVVMKRGL